MRVATGRRKETEAGVSSQCPCGLQTTPEPQPCAAARYMSQPHRHARALVACNVWCIARSSSPYLQAGRQAVRGTQSVEARNGKPAPPHHPTQRSRQLGAAPLNRLDEAERRCARRRVACNGAHNTDTVAKGGKEASGSRHVKAAGAGVLPRLQAAQRAHPPAPACLPPSASPWPPQTARRSRPRCPAVRPGRGGRGGADRHGILEAPTQPLAAQPCSRATASAWATGHQTRRGGHLVGAGEVVGGLPLRVAAPHVGLRAGGAAWGALGSKERRLAAIDKHELAAHAPHDG